jgi:hypothetical protein
MQRMKNKTFVTWITFAGGPLGLHRFYLYGAADRIGWLLLAPTLLGVYGLERAQRYGLDDPWIWLLIPLLGFNIAGCALNALVYGLMGPEKWNIRFNPGVAIDAPAGQTHWGTIAALVLSLFIGTATLMASLAFGFQRYFEYEAEATLKISQSPPSAQH